MMIFSPNTSLKRKKVLFDDFFMTTWDQENVSEKKKEPQILYLNQLTLLIFFQISPQPVDFIRKPKKCQ